ncbi:MAG: UGSC family (seleno)protein [Chloroflexota bacterium]
MDQLNIERLGIPTVTIMTTPFSVLAKTVATAEGFPETAFLTVPHPVGMIPVADVIKKADNAFEAIMKLAIGWQPSGETAASQSAYPAERLKFQGSSAEVNELFLKREWSLGLPVNPPTPESVQEMLKGTTRAPDEVLGEVPPKMGVLTVELTAVHAVMAGCKPQYMPVLIAALEAFLSPEANWRGTLSTTGTTQHMVIVNGPVVKEIGIACDQGSAGKGHHANAAIGYALNLIGYAVGGSKPPSIDKSTLASPADFVCWVFGENEAEIPEGWDPLHVDRGFKRSDSVVTVMGSYPPIENIDHFSMTVEEHLRWWSRTIGPISNMGGPAVPIVLKQNPIIAVGPEHVALMAAEKCSKDEFKRGFWKATRTPLSVWPSGCTEAAKMPKRFPAENGEVLIPVVDKPEQLLVMIAGGEGKHSHYFPPFIGAFPVSKLVRP